MKKQGRKWIVLLMTVILTISVLPVQAMELTSEVPVESDESLKIIENSENDEYVEDEEDGQVVPEENEKNEEEQIDQHVNEKKNEELVSEKTEIEQRLNYVYVEKPYLETPETQRIVVSWGDGTENIESVSLNVQKRDGTQEEWLTKKTVDNLYLFEKEFNSTSQTDTYEVTNINVKTDSAIETFLMSELGVEAFFGVNEEYSGVEDLQPLDAEQASEENDVEMSVATIDGDGSIEEQNSIADALNAASQDILASTPSVMSLDNDVESVSVNATEKIVVALDPGHDSTHAGASNGALKEEVLTLKIANYCKAELEQYAGVEVYMTRTGATCPYPGSGSSAADIAKRAQAAAAAGAKIYVSFHLNSSTYSTPKGAEVIIPNNNWKPEVGTSGRALAQSILDELVKLGLTNRGLYSKDTSINEKYPDGSLADYFAVQIYNKKNGIPGIIVEHAFLSNGSDVNNFLSTESGLKKLGIADADGIAKYLRLSKGRWETDTNGNTYYYENNRKVYGQKCINGKWYYFDPYTGAMTIGWCDLPGKRVYYGPDGAMRYGQQYIDGKWYYFDVQSGAMTIGWCDLPGKRVYYGPDGAMRYDQQYIDGKWYYFDIQSGAMTIGWCDLPGKRVYYGSDGAMRYDQQYIDGKWYYFDVQSGAMTIGWVDLPGKRVYYGPDGAMRYNQQKIDGKWYYFDVQSGAMTIGWCDLPGKRVYYGPDGAMWYGQQNIDNIWYYFDVQTGAVSGGWVNENGITKYYYQEGGYAKGQKNIDGKWYHFDVQSGAMTIGWCDLPGKRVYYGPDGTMRYNQQKINGKWYYFDIQSGAMTIGWCDLPGKRVYYGPDGAMRYGQQNIDNIWYYFDMQTGAVSGGWVGENGIIKYYYQEGGYAKGQKNIDGKWYHFDVQSGAMTIGWCDLPGKRVYYGPDGAMRYNQQKIDGKWYYFDVQSGAMTIGWYDLPGKRVYYGPDGAMRYNQQKIDGKWYYFDVQSGAMTIGWYNLPGKRVYYGPDGAMRYNQQYIDGKWYYFDVQSGAMTIGWCDLPGKRVYYGPDGAMRYNQQKIDGKWYYFDVQSGAMTIGWCDLPGKRVYYGSDGAMLYGEQQIEGKKYFFDINTGEMIRNAWVNGHYYGNDGIQLFIDESMNCYSIMGTTFTTVEQMVRFYNVNSPISYPSNELSVGGAADIKTLAQIFYEEASKEEIKVEVAWCQSMLETGWLKFNGQVSIKQFNFAGIGALDGGANGADFSCYGENGVRMGVRAQIQHLKAYASTTASRDTLKEVCVDPRFDLVNPKGCAQYVEYLGQNENPIGKGWATDVGYGYKILNLINILKKS